MNNTYKRELIVCEHNGEELTFETVTEVANHFGISYFQAYRAVNVHKAHAGWKISKQENHLVKRSAYIRIKDRIYETPKQQDNDGL